MAEGGFDFDNPAFEDEYNEEEETSFPNDEEFQKLINKDE